MRARQVALIDALARHELHVRTIAAPQARRPPARAHWMASAVPHEPAPSTAMSACAARRVLTDGS